MNSIDGNNNNLTLVYTEKKGKKEDLMTNEIDRLRKFRKRMRKTSSISPHPNARKAQLALTTLVP